MYPSRDLRSASPLEPSAPGSTSSYELVAAAVAVVVASFDVTMPRTGSGTFAATAAATRSATRAETLSATDAAIKASCGPICASTRVATVSLIWVADGCTASTASEAVAAG